MAQLSRVLKILASIKDINATCNLADVSPVSTEAPQVLLGHVDTQLNMHQFNGFFEDGATLDGLDATSPPTPSLPSIPSHPTLSTTTTLNNNNLEAPNEWSAVGHAATGKSGRVIHNLQEEIARLTRECSLYRSRSEETQRMNEALKIQDQNMTERLRNLEQVNETNLNSISRKDRKIEELRADVQGERSKRQDAETSANQVIDTARTEKTVQAREVARLAEIAKYYENRYEVLVTATDREKTEMQRRVNAIDKRVNELHETVSLQDDRISRLDVLAEQKNREVETLKDSNQKLLDKHAEYKEIKENENLDLLTRTRGNNDTIDAVLASLQETQAKMRWVTMLSESRAEMDVAQPPET
ncbi:hypothetical protein N7495_004702 [Penicillium taxi]|uniref:uncharacterized protein n=1 Tax=Penicillium taxi TaxID=168475 RepID=UPI002544E157|nr:uncharacterized protein N7495_004702 [Penicillium taxi]KAJ5899958.1 hypothetical protein N7495_004702 [Penicillium taxi]